MPANSNALRQNAQGRWDLTLRHDKPNIDLEIPVKLTYRGTQVSMTVKYTEQTVNTGWYTELGVPIDTNDIIKYAQPVIKGGKTYTVTGWTIDVEEYHDSGTTEDYLTFSPTSKQVASSSTSFTLSVSSNTSWSIGTNTSVDWLGMNYNSGTGNKDITVTIEANNDGEGRDVTILGYIGSTQKASCEITQSSGGDTPQPPAPEYTLLVTIEDGYNSTIDACGTTKVIATLYDGLGGSSAVTDSCDWLIITGAGYINIDTSTNPVTVTGRGNATSREQECKVMARYNNTLTAATSIFVLQNPLIPPFISLVNESDLTRFQSIPCLGLASPGYEIGISSNVAWRARLSDIDDEYWLHVSYNANTVTVYIDENVDPYSGEGGSARTSSFIIEAVDSGLGVSSITITVNQASCSDRINVPDKGEFVFDCNSPSSYTRNIVAWDDVEWYIEADFRAYQDVDWFSVSPTSGMGNGQFTVTILKDNFDNETRGSGYIVFKTGSTQTPVDWDINVKQEPTPFFEITGSVAHVPATSGSVTVTVETNKEIQATTSDTWIQNLQVGNNVSQVGGTAYTEVTFDVTENSSEDSGRTGTITIQSLYSGDCGSLGSKTIQVIQDASTSTSASFIHVRKIDEPVTEVHQSISFPIDEALASTTEMWFVLSADGDCKLHDITSSTGDEGLLGVYMVDGNIDVDVTNGAPFSLIGSATFKAVYGTPYAREKNFKLTFKTKKGTGTGKTATVEIQQEREYEIGVTNVYFDYVSPTVIPWAGNSCNWLLTTMTVQIFAERLFNSGRRSASEQICNYIKVDPNNQQLQGVDHDILTLSVTNNPTGTPKYCIILPDELEDYNGYHSVCERPFQIQFSPNSGNTPNGQNRNVNFELNYQDNDGNTAATAFTVTVPYCYVEPVLDEVYIVDGNDLVDELVIENYPVGTLIDVQLTGLTVGETKLSFDCDESFTETIFQDFEIDGEPFDGTSPLNYWTATKVNPHITFIKGTSDEVSLYIDCSRSGYADKRLVVTFGEAAQGGDPGTIELNVNKQSMLFNCENDEETVTVTTGAHVKWTASSEGGKALFGPDYESTITGVGSGSFVCHGLINTKADKTNITDTIVVQTEGENSVSKRISVTQEATPCYIANGFDYGDTLVFGPEGGTKKLTIYADSSISFMFQYNLNELIEYGGVLGGQWATDWSSKKTDTNGNTYYEIEITAQPWDTSGESTPPDSRYSYAVLDKNRDTDCIKTNVDLAATKQYTAEDAPDVYRHRITIIQSSY